MEVISPFRLPRKTPFGLAEHVTEWATGLSQLDKFYAQRPVHCDTETFLRFTLQVLGIDYQVVKGSINQVPTEGATVIVANHPLGCVEGVILAEMLLMIRQDLKILANHYLKTVPELDKLFIGVDVLNGKDAVKANLRAMREAHRHVAQGGLLLLFPAGEVSQLVNGKTNQVEDKEWSRSVSALIKRSQATTIPIFIHGQNSKRFYMAGKVHSLLRTLMLGRELLNKSQQPIEITIGSAIRYKEISALNDDCLVSYLRLNTYLLKPQSTNHRLFSTSSHSDVPAQPISAPLNLNRLEADFADIPKQDHLLTSGEFEVYCTRAKYIPNLLYEIGRLREENFRAVGEGTGKALDIDHFDPHYRHLFVWDSSQRRLVGAYRLGLVDRLIDHCGMNGLYSRTLFNYDQRFLDRMGKSIELGRSVIAAEYQRSMSALLLLWKGIATFIQRNPDYTHLFGPVSISNDYSPSARQLLAESMEMHHFDGHGAQLVKASHPLRNKHTHWNTSMLSALGDLQLLSRVIARLDEGKSVPVLLRQYLALNGKLVSFNVDPDFNNALDGLIVVDLRQVPLKTLSRYMTKPLAEQYLNLHQA
ncbi:putative hemolysin [Vibrio ichthyoenteri ATCC 700023]|uniref:L-ornithine N(alpha)-acyltransferase n=1 Tax=Vibrio ichthyoenteri ATCC 700023 TaxID=870968 RepID=F9S492_9VIBR|nr:GNAT family N-acyltransferase [Vibrio ichthyoenteri]EGU37308.1 putative hemolysin [Vibrio ichthyoenteri ATCC 700023]